MTITTETTAVPGPCCPHCGADLLAVSYFHWEAGDWLILCVYCPEEKCRKTIHLQMLPNLAAGNGTGAAGVKIIDA